ncbi:hypothetical protein BA6E_10332 [Bacteroidales bacterium 6E]|nr:hypothetical protein BA6E_10332 [Bacteroidales bacterium 6E]
MKGDRKHKRNFIQHSMLVIVLMVMAGMAANAQTTASHEIRTVVPKVALVNVVSDHPAHAQSDASQPGTCLQNVRLNGNQPSEYWINYTSVLDESRKPRKVVARLQNGLPKGVKLVMETWPASGSSKGQTGMPISRTEITEEPAEIITGIGTSFTGKGSSNGHLVRLSLEVDPAVAQNSNGMPDDLLIAYQITE